jgi:hypothetical protein
MQARMRGLAQDAARRVASSIGTLQEVEGELHLQLDEMAPGMRLPPSAYYITRSLALDAELHPGFGLVAGQRVLVQWVGATPLIVDVLAAPGTTETLRFTPTSPAGGALTGDYPNPELAPDSVATAHIQAGAVTGSGSGAMLFATGGPAIAPGAIGGADIADNAITTPKLADGAVTAAKQAIAVGGVLAGTLPNPGHAAGPHTFGGLVTIDRAAGTAPPYLPSIEMRTPTNATGAGAFMRMTTGSGWSTAFGIVQDAWWHAFGDSTGGVVWGWNGSYLKRAGPDWTTVTYQNGYVGFGGGWGDVQYTKSVDGMVRFRGLLRCPTGWAHPIAAFTMPAGYRLAMEPGTTTGYHHFGCISNGPNGNGLGGITVHASGVISPWMGPAQTNGGDGQWFDMAGLAYWAG